MSAPNHARPHRPSLRHVLRSARPRRSSLPLAPDCNQARKESRSKEAEAAGLANWAAPTRSLRSRRSSQRRETLASELLASMLGSSRSESRRRPRALLGAMKRTRRCELLEGTNVLGGSSRRSAARMRRSKATRAAFAAHRRAHFGHPGAPTASRGGGLGALVDILVSAARRQRGAVGDRRRAPSSRIFATTMATIGARARASGASSLPSPRSSTLRMPPCGRRCCALLAIL